MITTPGGVSADRTMKKFILQQLKNGKRRETNYRDEGERMIFRGFNVVTDDQLTTVGIRRRKEENKFLPSEFVTRMDNVFCRNAVSTHAIIYSYPPFSLVPSCGYLGNLAVPTRVLCLKKRLAKM